MRSTPGWNECRFTPNGAEVLRLISLSADCAFPGRHHRCGQKTHGPGGYRPDDQFGRSHPSHGCLDDGQPGIPALRVKRRSQCAPVTRCPVPWDACVSACRTGSLPRRIAPEHRSPEVVRVEPFQDAEADRWSAPRFRPGLPSVPGQIRYCPAPPRNVTPGCRLITRNGVAGATESPSPPDWKRCA